MIYSNNYERDQQSALIIKKIKEDISGVSLKTIDGEQVLVNSNGKHALILDPTRKWVAGLDDLPALIAQLSDDPKPEPKKIQTDEESKPEKETLLERFMSKEKTGD